MVEHGEAGEVLGPYGDNSLAMLFPGNNGAVYIRLTSLSRDPPAPEKFSRLRRRSQTLNKKFTTTGPGYEVTDCSPSAPSLKKNRGPGPK